MPDLLTGDRRFYSALLPQICSKLESYHIVSVNIPHNVGSSVWNRSSYKLPKLKELCMKIRKMGNNNNIIGSPFDIFTSITPAIANCDLQRLHISLKYSGRAVNNNDFMQCITFIKLLLQTKKTLKYVSIEGDDGRILHSICDFINNKYQP
eukprot:310788_1